MTDPIVRCLQCQYWQRKQGEAVGECHLEPVMVVTKDDYWCSHVQMVVRA